MDPTRPPVPLDPAGDDFAADGDGWDDFAADGAGLLRAVEHLVAARSEATATPAGAPDAPLPLPGDLPAVGIGPAAALDELAGPLLRDASQHGAPGFFGHMDPPTPWMTWAASMWTASRNQNLLHPDTSPTARRVEETVVGWLAPFFGMDGGHVVPGSSVANLTALWAARDLTGVREVVSSDAAHLSVAKAARILGLAHRVVPTDDGQRLDRSRLGDVSGSAVVLTAGTTAAGAVDDLADVGARWVHVDAAWAGPLRLTTRFADRLDGIDRADSVAVSAHKWLFQPKESALVLFGDTATAHAAVSSGGGYLAVPNVGVLGSHGAAAVPLAVTLLAWGREGLARRIEHCMDLAAVLADRVRSHPELELFAEPSTGVVLWRPAGADLARVRAELRDAYVSTAVVAGGAWLRSVAANPRADPALVVASVLAAARHGR